MTKLEISSELLLVFRKFSWTSYELTITLVVFLLFLIYTKLLKRDSRISKYLDKIPGPKALPVVGNALTFAVPHTELLQTTRKLISTHGRILRLWMFNKPYVFLASAKNAEKILESPDHIERSSEYEVMRPWLGTSLVVAGGADWASRRKFLTPSFTFGLQDEFLQVFNEQGEIMRKVLEKECVGNGVVNLHPYCFRYSLDVICDAAMGAKIKAQTEKNVEYLKALMGVTGLIVTRIMRPWLKPNWIWKLSPYGFQEKKQLSILHSFTDNVIKERKDKLVNNPEMFEKIKGAKRLRLAFLDMLLQTQIKEGATHVLSDRDIRNETDLFMAAGHDTSGSALAWTLFSLAHHPEIQRKVQAELDSIYGDDPQRRVTSEDMTKMQYLEMCFKESLRLFPPIPSIFRKLYKDLSLPDGRILPAGITVAISIIDLHMDPEVYKNPEKFDPERFSPENCRGRNSYAWIPFSAGPRSCLGQRFGKIQAKFILSILLRHFWFEAAEPWDGVKIVPDVNLRPVNGLHFKVYRRDEMR